MVLRQGTQACLRLQSSSSQVLAGGQLGQRWQATASGRCLPMERAPSCIAWR